MEKERTVGIKLFGILALVCGIRLLYRFAVHFAGKPWVEFDETWLLWLASSSTTLALLVAACLLTSGWGLLKGRPWARCLLLSTTGVILLQLVTVLIIMGPCTEEVRYVAAFAVVACVVWFFNRKQTKAKFPPARGLRVFATILALFILSGLVWAAVQWFSQGGNEIPRLQRAVYDSTDEQFYSERYFRTALPLGYTLAVPRGSVIRAVEPSPGEGLMIVVSGPEECGLIINTTSFLQEMESTAKGFGYTGLYGFSRKLFAERYGLFFLAFSSAVLREGTYRVEEAQINGIKGFIAKRNGHGGPAADYYLFRGDAVLGEGTIFGGTESRNGHLIDAIISSIKLQDAQAESPQDLFTEAVGLLENGDFEKAKFSLVSALCLDWENAEYHYRIAEAFLQTDNVESAWDHLRKGMSLQRDYPGAQELLERVQAEKWK